MNEVQREASGWRDDYIWWMRTMHVLWRQRIANCAVLPTANAGQYTPLRIVTIVDRSSTGFPVSGGM